jgi:hypothetical protein
MDSAKDMASVNDFDSRTHLATDTPTLSDPLNELGGGLCAVAWPAWDLGIVF